MRAVALAFLAAGLIGTPPAGAQSTHDRVDVALVLAVDVSGSVDDNRFSLQMEGIARAFEDRDVQSTILSGPYGALLVTLVNWSQKPQIAVPWTVIASPADAMAFAGDVRRAPRRAEDFTCMSLMMQVVGEKVLPLMPVIAGLSANHLAALNFAPALRRLYVARDNDAAGIRAANRLYERGLAAGIEVFQLVPETADFNADLCQLGPASMLARLMVQIEQPELGRFIAG